MSHSLYRYAKANDKYMEANDKNKELSYFQYWDVNNLYGWAITQKLPVNKFNWIEDTCQFNENFVKKYFLEVDVQYFE